jgi:hypothetical protein
VGRFSVSLAVYWEAVSTLLKVVLVPLIIFGTPAISDLFQTYTEYASKWHGDNPAGGS